MRIVALALFALSLCGCAADPAATKAQFDRGLQAYDAGDYPRAYALWNDIRDDDLAALRNVAMMLRTGKGVEKDTQKAAILMARVADTGLPLFPVIASEADLGEMLLDGEAGPPDPAKAAFWLKLAADAGHPVAAYRLAGLFETGAGVPQDLDAARAYYDIAARAGYKDAAERLKDLPRP